MPKLFGRDWEKAELLRHVGQLSAVGGVQAVELGDGRERGVRTLQFRTGTGFAFSVMVDRGLDIGPCEFRGQSLGWHSSAGWPHPSFFEPSDPLGVLRTIGGMLFTCGLDHTLGPCEDTASQYHLPYKKMERYPLHGRIANLPARLTSYGERWEGNECVLFAEGVISQAAVFGENLRLIRRIESRLGANGLRIHDVVENVGYDPTPHMILYHVNTSFPLVMKGAEFVGPIEKIEWSNESGRGIGASPPRRASYKKFSSPVVGFVEQAWQHKMRARAGWVTVAILNRSLGLGLELRYRRATLPFFLEWRNMAAGNYVVGIEPGNAPALGRLAARKSGQLVILQPGERREYDLEISVLNGLRELSAARKRIRAVCRQP